MERFVARIEIRPAFDPDELTEADLDTDNLEQVAQLLHEFEQTGIAPEDESQPKQFSFDLCQECRNKFSTDPLGRGTPKHLRFSNN